MKTRIGSLFLLILLALTFKPSVAVAYYDPELGRFIQPDTIIPDLSNPQSYNRYSYCVNNPLRYTDPTGHQIPSPANMALGWSAPPGMEAQWNQSFQAANAQAAALSVGALAGTATAGVAAPVLVGAGASPAFAAVGSGIVGGVAGDAAAQGTQIGLGIRSSFSGQEMAVSGLAGGAINGTVAGVGKVISSAGTPQAASSPALQAATTVANDVNLTAAQQAKLTAFNKSLPNANTGTAVDKVGNQVLFTSDVPGRVPGSKAVYQKTVDTSGKTTSMLKTTFDPKGNVVHIKDKLSPPPQAGN